MSVNIIANFFILPALKINDDFIFILDTFNISGDKKFKKRKFWRESF